MQPSSRPARSDAPKYDVPAPPVAPGFFSEWLGVRWPAIVIAAAFAGLLDASVRALGVDPSLFVLQVQHFGFVPALQLELPRTSELPGVLGCVAVGVLHYAAVGAVLGLVPAFALTALRRHFGRPWSTRELAAARTAAWTIGLWLAVALYWWTRPAVFPGLSATDPKRLAAAGGLLVVGVLIGHVLVRLFGRRRWRPRSRFAGVLALIALVGAGRAAVQWSSEGGRGALQERNVSLPNVLLIIVDALRQDVIGAYGNTEVHTPNIDRLAAEGVVFENAFAPTPFTWPSFGSILTGKVPRRHGLMRMAPGVRMPVNATLPLLLEEGVREDGTQLEETDWLQGAFMTGTLSHGSGLLDGFDVYLEALVGHEMVDIHSRWSKFRSGLLPWLVLNKLEQKGDRQLVTTTAEAWLERQSGRRTLTMVHLYSTHTPYNPAPEFRARHLDPKYDGPFDTFVAAHREAIEDGDYEPTAADIEQIRDLYLAGVEEADTMIGRMVERLRSLGALDDTIVIVTSDHGESLGEHGLWEHNWMYQDNLRVPLVLRFPVGLPAGRRVEAQVGLIDIVPTVLDLMGIEGPTPAAQAEALAQGLDGELDMRNRLLWDAVDGSSLVPLISGEVERLRSVTFAENGLFLAAQDGRWKLIVRRELTRDGAYRELRTKLEAGAPGVERPRLFDLSADTAELVNRFDVGDEAALAEADRLFAAIEAENARLPIREDQVERGGRDVRAERLFRGLGYADGVGVAVEDVKEGAPDGGDSGGR